jgi:hypothetical protein
MPDEPKTLSDDELLFRQVNPGWVRDGRVTSQAFRPTPKDAGLLSVDRASLTTPESSFRLFTEGLRLPSAGTWAVTVHECSAQSLPVVEDSLTSPPEPVANPAHAVISYKGVASNSQVESKGQKLARCAHARGRLFPPTSPSQGSGAA